MKPGPLLLLLTAFFCFSLRAQGQSDEKYRVRLASGTFIPASSISEAKVRQLDRSLARVAGKSMILIQFQQHPDAAVLNQLRASGAQVQGYLSGNAFPRLLLLRTTSL